MRIYLKDTIDALQTLIIKITTDISNGEISINTCEIRNKIYGLIRNQTIGNKIKRIVMCNNEQ